MDETVVFCRSLEPWRTAAGLGESAMPEARRWRLARSQGLDRVLAWQIIGRSGGSWSERSRARARRLLAAAAASEEVQRQALIELVEALRTSGVDLLLMKGAAWAYQAYDSPALRPRMDADVLIRRSDRRRVAAALAELGYQAQPENLADLATAQGHFVKRDRWQRDQFLDVHWRVTNPLVYADALPFERVWARSTRIDALGGARGFCAIDALLHACLHRLAHHGGGSSAIWVYDVHQLSRRMDRGGWDEVVREAIVNRLCGACFHGLSRSAELFGTEVPASVLEQLAAGKRPEEEAFAGRRISALGMLVSDWRALDTWSARLRLLGAHLFPGREYMRSKYGTGHPLALPLLYAYRTLAGLPRWLAGLRR
ncbi:MAG: nucleotidyltransferase family protein [Acidobacteria bacterium]|nr:nucleotidyltransferase family protein [Acidobacteriota bacterium]